MRCSDCLDFSDPSLDLRLTRRAALAHASFSHRRSNCFRAAPARPRRLSSLLSMIQHALVLAAIPGVIHQSPQIFVLTSITHFLISLPRLFRSIVLTAPRHLTLSYTSFLRKLSPWEFPQVSHWGLTGECVKSSHTPLHVFGPPLQLRTVL